MVTITQAVGPAAHSRIVQRVLKRVVGHLPGPSAEGRAKNQGQLWGQATDANGGCVTGRITTLDPYDLTADTVVRIAQRLSAGAVSPGAHTPSSALGPDFVRELDGAKVHGLD